MIENLLKTKFFGYTVALVGLALFLRGIADLGYYVFGFGNGPYSEPLVETVMFLMADFVCIVAAVALWAISAKVLQAKS